MATSSCEACSRSTIESTNKDFTLVAFTLEEPEGCETRDVSITERIQDHIEDIHQALRMVNIMLNYCDHFHRFFTDEQMEDLGIYSDVYLSRFNLINLNRKLIRRIRDSSANSTNG